MIIQADILDAFGALYLRICATVTRIAERYKILNLICFLVAFQPKQAEWADMMHRLSSRTAVPTGIIVTLQGLSPLSLPVRAAIVAPAVNVLWMVQSMAVFVATWARTIFTAAFACFQPDRANFKGVSTIKAHERPHFGLFRPCFNGCVLALWRTVKPATMFQAAYWLLEQFAAISTSDLDPLFRRGVLGGLSLVTLAHARHRAVLCFCGAIGFDIEGSSAGFAK